MSPQDAYVEKSNGRLTTRKLTLCSVGPTESGMPYTATLLKVDCQQSSQSEWETRYYISSAKVNSRSPASWSQRIRNHWRSESMHWQKDSTLQEDRTRTRNPTIMSNLIQLRNMVIHYYREFGEEQAAWLPIWVEQNQADVGSMFTMLTQNRR